MNTLTLTPALRADGFDASEDGTGRGTPLVPVLPFDTTQLTSATNRSNPKPGDPCHPLAVGAHSVRTANTSSNGWGVQEECTHTLDCAQGVAVAHPPAIVEVAGTMSASGATSKKHGFGWGQQDWENGYCQPTNLMQVRRLTPRECERLQGFPDDYTLIPWRRKPASECPDGPRYKALGNSWAVPCVHWIGRRIEEAM